MRWNKRIGARAAPVVMHTAAALAFLLLTSAAALQTARAQVWQPLPLRTAAIRDAGNPGGEGCQVIQNIAVDSTGNFLLMGTDVGGIYRSLNGGTSWEPCNVGYTPRGGIGPAIDPNNSNRCLFAGANSSAWDWHGIYLSTDQGATWRNVLPLNYAGQGDQRDQIAYAPSSLSGGMSATVYWSAPGALGLYKSTNGGAAWSKIQTSYGGGRIKVHPTLGYVYLANDKGLYRSKNGGSTFSQILRGAVTGLDVVPTQPSSVYASQNNKVYVSVNSGDTFTARTVSGLPTTNPKWYALKVSPADPNDMVIVHDTGNWYDQPRYASSDGGTTWRASTFDNRQSFMPFNGRGAAAAWHPTQANTLWSTGGDWITRSTDGGSTYAWDANGYTGVCATGRFCFSTANPNTLLMTTQDYNSAVTLDGGSTWKYLNVSGNGWGGYNYGGYAFDATHLFAGDTTSWGGTRYLKVSHDGGGSWIATGLAGNSNDAACGDPGALGAAFWNQYRTLDYGQTWSAMAGCQAVFTFNPVGSKELYGKGAAGNTVVKSTDHGATWTVVATFPSTVWDVAYDQVRNRLYAVGDGRTLYQWEAGTVTDITGRLPADTNYGARGANTVAVDPVNPGVVYVGKHADIYATDTAVVRSTDGGITWTTLTKKAGGSGPDGAREVVSIRVHPVTREAYVGGGCYGIWKIAPP